MKKYILLVLAAFFSIYTAAAAERILTIEQAVDLARANNLSLKSADIDLLTKKRAKDTAWNKFLPSLQANGTMIRWNTEQSMSGISGFNSPVGSSPGGGLVYDQVFSSSFDLPRWGLSAGLDLSLNLNLALMKEIESTRIDYRSGRISRETAEKQMERDVRKNFYNILVFKENIKLMEQNVTAAEERYLQAKTNYSNGLVPELSVLSAQVGWENLKPALAEMHLGYTSMLDSFKMMLGIPITDSLEVKGDIQINPIPLDWQKLSDQFLARRLDLQSLTTTIESLKTSKSALQLQAMTPTLALGLSFDPAFQGDPLKDNWFSQMGDNWKQQSGMLRLTLALSLDSFLPGSKTRAGIHDMEDGIRKAEIGLDQARAGARMEIKTLVMKLKKSADQLKVLALNVELAERAYRMSREAYRAGSKELLEVEDSERDLNNAKLEVLKEKYNYLTGMLDLEYALNATLDDIKEVNND